MSERKRKHLKRYDCSEIQGEGAYVVMSSVKVREIRAARKTAADNPEYDEFEGGVELLVRHIAEWNFVDDDGNDLDLPKNNEAVVGDLTNEECEFLVECLMGGETIKN